VGLIFLALIVRYTAGRADEGKVGAYFWIFSAIAIFGALRVITHPRPVYSALYFVLTVMASAGLFILLWAEFMAAALVLIYAGAILVTYVFVIMLASQSQSGASADPPYAGLAEYDAVSREPLVASAVGFALMGVLLYVIFDRAQAIAIPPNSGPMIVNNRPAPTAAASPAAKPVRTITSDPLLPGEAGSTQMLGEYLFKNQMVNLELAGLILTVSMVGAIIIARRRVVAAEGFEAPPEVISAKLTPLDDSPHSIPVYGTDNPRQKEYPQT